MLKWPFLPITPIWESTHFGDTLTAAFALPITGDANLEYDLFQELIYYSDEPYDLKSLVTYTPEVSTVKKTAVNKGQMIREQFDKIAPYMASIERPKVTVNLNQTLGSTSDEIVAWVDSLNDSTATMANWTLALYGFRWDGATEKLAAGKRIRHRNQGFRFFWW
jgi:hypothetical protein